ncbi:MAG: hypothetical protein LBT71_00835 [Azoarcus sp.]|nr:hypothetical protein [Azoarcus sp.]
MFIFILFLLVVFGRMYYDADISRSEALARLSKRQQEDALPKAREAFEAVRQALRTQLDPTGANVDEVLKGLLDKAHAEAEVDELKVRVQELNTQLAGLSGIRDVLAQAGKAATLNGATEDALISALELRARLAQKVLANRPASASRELTDSEISSQTLTALELRRQIEMRLEKELGQPLAPGQEAVWAKWLLDTRLLQIAGGASESNVPRARTGGGDIAPPRQQQSAATVVVQSEVSQPPPAGVDITSLHTRLGTQSNDAVPPCWVDRVGNVQFLLTLELRSSGVLVSPAWPPGRETEARAIPGIDRLLIRGPIAYRNFDERIQTVAQHSGSQCHYAVQVKDNMRDAMRSERVHQQLEALFNLAHLPR